MGGRVSGLNLEEIHDGLASRSIRTLHVLREKERDETLPSEGADAALIDSASVEPHGEEFPFKF